MTEKENKFITVFDEVISNREKIKTPDDVGKALDSLQEVVYELFTEPNPVGEIDHELLVKYNKFLTEDLAKVSIDFDCFGRRKNSLKESSLPTELEGKGFKDISSRIKSKSKYSKFKTNRDIKEYRFFECYRVYLNPTVWSTYNSISEWYTKEFLNKDSITNHTMKLFSIIDGFYKIMLESDVSFSIEERPSWKNLAQIQLKVVSFVKGAAIEIIKNYGSKGHSLYPELMNRNDVSDLFEITAEGSNKYLNLTNK